MNACMHVCMYACMYLCMYVCMYACMHVCMHVCIHVCMCVFMCVLSTLLGADAHTWRMLKATGDATPVAQQVRVPLPPPVTGLTDIACLRRGWTHGRNRGLLLLISPKSIWAKPPNLRTKSKNSAKVCKSAPQAPKNCESAAQRPGKCTNCPAGAKKWSAGALGGVKKNNGEIVN